MNALLRYSFFLVGSLVFFGAFGLLPILFESPLSARGTTKFVELLLFVWLAPAGFVEEAAPEPAAFAAPLPKDLM
jgi:hypothetical protein